MATVRHGKRTNSTRLTAVDGCGQPSGDGELVELRMQLAAAGVPQEVLRALDDARDTEEALENLIKAGVLPSPDQALTGLLEGWEPLCKPGADVLSAELAGAEFLGLMRQTAPEPDEVPEILAGLIGHAASTARPEALAMLRVLAVGGPPEIRLAAAEAADRLVAAGLTDRPWVSKLGTPQVGPCFGFVDECGAQEGVTVTFTYARKVHAFVVLIDHGLGGGVKDCFVAEHPDTIRAEYRKVTKRHSLDYRDYPPATARSILDRALTAPPCPVEPDQVEDVGSYLDLLRQRVALLPHGVVAPVAKPGVAGTRRAPVATVHKVKITLRGARPPIWRRPVTTAWPIPSSGTAVRRRRRWMRSPGELATASATPTTSVTIGSTRSSSRTCSPPRPASLTHAVWLAAGPARPRTAAVSGGTKNCARSWLIPATLSTATGLTGSGWNRPSSSPQPDSTSTR